MKWLLPGLTAATLAASFAIAPVAPVNAAPVFVPKSEQLRTDIQTVRDGRGEREWRKKRNWRAERRSKKRYARRDLYDDDYYYYRRDYRRRPTITLHFSF